MNRTRPKQMVIRVSEEELAQINIEYDISYLSNNEIRKCIQI